MKQCTINKNWKSSWEDKNSSKYSAYVRGTNYYAYNFLEELKPKFDLLLGDMQQNSHIWNSQFNKFHHSVETLKTQLKLEELKNLITDYDDKIQEIKAIESAELRFEKQQNLYNKLINFRVDVSHPQKDIKKSLHEVIRHRLYVMIFSNYHIPSRHYDVLNKIFAENPPNQKAVDVLRSVEDEIYFSKDAIIFKIENKLDLRLPVDIYPFLTGVVHFSKGKTTFNENLLSNEFSELSNALNAIIGDKSTEIKNVFELSNLLTTQLTRPLTRLSLKSFKDCVIPQTNKLGFHVIENVSIFWEINIVLKNS